MSVVAMYKLLMRNHSIVPRLAVPAVTAVIPSPSGIYMAGKRRHACSIVCPSAIVIKIDAAFPPSALTISR